LCKIDIKSKSLKELEEEFISFNYKKYNALQVYSWLHAKNIKNFDEMTDI